MHRFLRRGRFTACLIVVVAAHAGLVASGARAQELFAVPTDRPVAEPFNLANGPYGRGNRGIEYATVEGDRIVAAAAGEVVFAGAVAGSLYVTVQHPSGLRSSYSFLEETFVRVGSRVRTGQLLAAASVGFHFTIRDGDNYLDPADLLGEVRVRVRLVGSSRTQQPTRRQIEFRQTPADGYRLRAASQVGAFFGGRNERSSHRVTAAERSPASVDQGTSLLTVR